MANSVQKPITDAELTAALEKIQKEQQRWFVAHQRSKIARMRVSPTEKRIRTAIWIGNYLAEFDHSQGARVG